MPPAEDKLKGRAAPTGGEAATGQAAGGGQAAGTGRDAGGGQAGSTGRDAQRLQTRQRVYAAALAEFKRTGMAAADVRDIAAAAGVARGTFYFHFPTKEHVLAEFERQEEARLVAQLAKFVAQLDARCGPPSSGARSSGARSSGAPSSGAPSSGAPSSGELSSGELSSGQEFLPAALGEVVRLLTALERRVGKTLFREMLGLHFSSRRPDVLPGADKWADYPIMTSVIEIVERARERGEVYPGADALRTAQFFMLGLYAMLITSHEYSKAARAEILDNFMATVLRGVQSRL
jgi:TetR/AcrR family transcriptional regulator, repressor for uid operon